MSRLGIHRTGIACAAAACMAAITGSATADIITKESSKYLLIGMGPANSSGGQPGVGDAVNVNNFELGANKAPVPAPTGFGPGLLGNVPNIPLIARYVDSGILGGGNVAITHVDGRFNLQDVGVYGNLGIHLQGTRTTSNAVASNSFFNDPNMYPNTFNPTGPTNPGVNKNTGGTGTPVNANNAVQANRMDAPNWAGVTGNVDLSPLRNEIAANRAAINALTPTSTLNLPNGTINSDTTINLAPGLNVIDIVTNGNDFLVQNSNLVIQGGADSYAIFLLPDKNMLVSQANILVGDGGIGLNNVLFFTDHQSNDQHFNINNAVLNGISLWSTGLAGGGININNAQGCVQLIADKITLNDVRFGGCGFNIPAPSGFALLALGLISAARRRR
jgi:hypothetical protein